MRVMDCMDCHNRPSHTFEMAERALDHAFQNNLIPATLPFAKKTGMEVLKASYATRDDAAQKLPAAFAAWYRQNQPAVYAQRATEVEAAGKQVFAVWSRNVFPEMNVTWGTYPNNIGHTDFPGCFRCHDGAHTAADGRTIGQDCNTCHNILAMEEQSPKVLTELGVEEKK
jgi:hypothetical protein